MELLIRFDDHTRIKKNIFSIFWKHDSFLVR